VFLLLVFPACRGICRKNKESGLTGAYSTKESPFGLQKPEKREYCHSGDPFFSEAKFMPADTLRKRQPGILCSRPFAADKEQPNTGKAE
jgi:hypothetical protein